jgi:hypothetical protein
MWKGETPFGVTFWLYGVLLTTAVCWATWHMVRWVELGWLAYSIVSVALVGYGFLASVAIWRSSGRSSVSRVWVYGARSAVGLGWLAAVALIGFAILIGGFDFGTTSHTIQAELHPDPALPYIGFWKTDCADDHGIAIEKAAADAYFVRFCGPGGCFGKTPFTRSSLVDDPRYEIVDHDTIGVRMTAASRQRALPKLSPEDRKRVQKSIRGDLLLFKRCK